MKNLGFILLVLCIFAKATTLSAQDETFESLFRTAFECRDCTDSTQIKLFTAAIDYGTSDPLDFNNFTNALINRGTLYSQTGNYAAAISDFKRALELEPDSRNVWQKLGTAFLEEGEYTEAIESYDTYISLLEIEKQNVLMEFPIRKDSNAAPSAKKFNQEIRENAIDNLNSLLARAHNNRGIARAHLHNQSEACADFRKAFELGMTGLKEFLDDNCD